MIYLKSKVSNVSEFWSKELQTIFLDQYIHLKTHVYTVTENKKRKNK